MWQDKEIRFDVFYTQMQLRAGEIMVDKLDLIEDTKGNSGDNGRLIVTNLRILWHSLSLPRINLSIGFNTFVTINSKTVSTVTIKNSKFGPTLVILSNENNGGYVLGFRINPIQKLNTLHKEINILITAYNKSPIFGVDYTLEYQGPMEEEIHPERFSEIQDNQADISDAVGYYFFEGGFMQRKANFSNYLGLAIEDPREGSTLQNLWELVPST